MRILAIVQFSSVREKEAYEMYFNALLSTTPQQQQQLQLPSNQQVQAFFRRSKLPRIILQRIWDYCDQGQMTSFDQNTFNLGLRMIAMAQNGREPNLIGLNDEPTTTAYLIPSTVPRFSGYEHVLKDCFSFNVCMVDWLIRGIDTEYQNFLQQFRKQTFNSNDPYLPYDCGIQYLSSVLLDNHLLDNPQLMKHIWFLADYDQDMKLDGEEFCVAMYLIQQLNRGQLKILPNCLPIELIPPSKRGGLDPSNLNSSTKATAKSPLSEFRWLISDSTTKRSDFIWTSLASSSQLCISKSQLPHIATNIQAAEPLCEVAWSLVDTHNLNRLSKEQFVWFVHIVEQMNSGAAPPSSISALPLHIKQMFDGLCDKCVLLQQHKSSQLYATPSHAISLPNISEFNLNTDLFSQSSPVETNPFNQLNSISITSSSNLHPSASKSTTGIARSSTNYFQPSSTAKYSAIKDMDFEMKQGQIPKVISTPVSKPLKQSTEMDPIYGNDDSFFKDKVQANLTESSVQKLINQFSVISTKETNSKQPQAIPDVFVTPPQTLSREDTTTKRRCEILKRCITELRLFIDDIHAHKK